MDWKRKLCSRKLWLAVAGFVAGLIVLFGGSEAQAEKVSGSVLSGAAVIAYAVGEGLADSGGALANTFAEDNKDDEKDGEGNA